MIRILYVLNVIAVMVGLLMGGFIADPPASFAFFAAGNLFAVWILREELTK
jgi:hypothetical protein